MIPFLRVILLTCAFYAFPTISYSNSITDQFLLYPEIKDNSLILGALFPIHDYNSSSPNQCGKLQVDDGIFPLEALLFSVEEINKRKKLLPGITISILAYDSCNSPDVAIKQSLRFAKGFMATHEADFTCSNGGTPIYQKGDFDKIVGVIGEQHSSISIQMSNVLKLFNIPQISYLSTSVSLSDRELYPNFLRTIPVDTNQVEAIVQILRYLKITYVSIVYSNSDYGVQLVKELELQFENTEICFAKPLALSVNDKMEIYEKVVEKLDKRKRTRVVIFFGDMQTADKLFTVVEKHRKKFLWIGSDAWTIIHSKALTKYARILSGSIGIQSLARLLPGFEKFQSNLQTSFFSKNNNWFQESWNHRYVGVNWLHFLYDAAFAFAHALHDMWVKFCSPKPGLCGAMSHDGHIHGKDLIGFLKNVSFLDSQNQTFKFQENGAGIPRHTVFIFEKPIDGQEADLWKPIGDFQYINDSGDLHLHYTSTEWDLYQGTSCGVPCGPNQAQIFSTEDKCCWICETCSEYEILNNITNFCEKCPYCERSNVAKTKCVEKDNKFVDYQNEWAVTSATFAALGLASSLFIGIIFWVYLDTPVIKAANRELSYILLTGIILSFFLTFAILAPPCHVTCGFTRFFIGFAYTVCYAALLTKTNLISRIFNKNGAQPQKAKFSSPRWQITIAFALIFVEVVINSFWLIYNPPKVKKICESAAQDNFLICQGIDNYSYVVGLVYPFALLCFCTFFAIKTRKSPDGFNEARYVAFTNYTMCILWIVFVPLYLSTPDHGIRLVSLAMSLSLSGFVQLCCLFIPKVHVVLFKPEKNTRNCVMADPKAGRNPESNAQSLPAGISVSDFDAGDGLESYGTTVVGKKFRYSIEPNKIDPRPSEEPIEKDSGYPED